MASIVMKGNGHEVPMAEAYGDEVMCAGWNPQLPLAGDECPAARRDKHVNLLADLASVDVDAFLKRMYEYQG